MKMKTVQMLGLSFMALSAFFISPASRAEPTERPWNTLQCNKDNRKDAESYIVYTRARLKEAEDYVRGCESTGNVGTPDTSPTTPVLNTGCIQYIIGKGFGPDAAKKNCEGLLENEVDCVKMLIEKGNGPSTARKSCEGLTEIGFQCFKYMQQKGFGAQTSKSNCAGITEVELQCVKDLIQKGYSVSKSRQTCKSGT